MSRYRSRPRSAGHRLTAAAIATVACACVSVPQADAAGTDTEPVVSRGVTIPAFYTPPAQLPAANGT